MKRCAYKVNGNDSYFGEDEELDEALRKLKKQYFERGNEQLGIGKDKNVTKN